MKLRTLFILTTVLFVLFALGALLGPATVLKSLGFTTGKTEALFAQVLGAALLGFAAVAWFARDSSDPQSLRAATVALLIFDSVAFVVTLLGMLSQVTRSGGAWLLVVVFLLLAGGYAYFQFATPSE